MKNYFTSAYYVAHSKGLWFTGMNYPYGEHPIYTDNQPVWSLLLKFIDLFTPMQQHVVGTLNMLLVLSLIVAVIAVYFVLREFNLPGWYAALISLPLVFLSPQLERFQGHYSLAYVCYIPLFLLLFIRWHKDRLSWKRGIFVLLFIIWIGFTHLYFFFIAVAFVFAYTFIEWMRNRFRWSAALSRMIALIVVSAIAVYLPVKVTDPITDRPKEVYGIYVFAATAEGTFLPWHGQWKDTWTQEYSIKAPDTESHTYLGIAGVLLAPFILFYALRNLLLRKRRREVLSSSAITAGAVGAAGFLVWIMATGWFYMAGGEVLVDLFPVIGQFRSLGRLAWIFYFTYGCFAGWWLYDVIRNISKRWIKVVCVTLVSALFIVWCLEANTYARLMFSPLFHHNHTLRGDKPYLALLNSKGLTPDTFQAIFQLPSIIIGTENLPVHRGHWEFNNSIQCSWETGLPIVNYNMSRTSVSHALSLLQMISTPDIAKVRIRDMDDRPLLLISHEAQLLPTERRLIALAEHLGTVGHMQVHSLNLQAFTMPEVQDTVSQEVIMRESFESRPFDDALDGTGATDVAKDSVFYTFIDSSGTETQFSCWVYIAAHISSFPAIQVRQFGPDNMQIDEQVHSIHSFSPWQVKGHWVQVTFPLTPRVVPARYSFSTLAQRAVIDMVEVTKRN